MKLYKYILDSNKENPQIEMECITCKKIYKGYSSDKYEYILPKRNYNKYEWEIGFDEVNKKIFAGKQFIDSNYLTFYSDTEFDVNVVREMFKDYILNEIRFEEKTHQQKINKLTIIMGNITKTESN
jgi:hypothetical protein